eukprot:12799066-Prorocentrum_lima.AAC.1
MLVKAMQAARAALPVQEFEQFEVNAQPQPKRPGAPSDAGADEEAEARARSGDHKIPIRHK